MHVRPAIFLALSFVLLIVCADSQPQLNRRSLAQRDGHSHHSHNAAPLLVLNETEVTMHHAPTPPSYYTVDWEEEGYQSRHPGLMIFHGIFMSLAFFVALPIGALLLCLGLVPYDPLFKGIALRSVNHAAHYVTTLAFYGCCALGCFASALYRKVTPNMCAFSLLSYELVYLTYSWFRYEG